MQVWKDSRISEVLVGAVGIENNDEQNLKDLRGMRRNAKLLKRNERACKGILIAPSKLPRLSSVLVIAFSLQIYDPFSLSEELFNVFLRVCDLPPDSARGDQQESVNNEHLAHKSDKSRTLGRIR